MEDSNIFETLNVQQPQADGQVNGQAQKTVDEIVGEAVMQPTAEEQAYLDRVKALEEFLIQTDTEVPPEQPALSVDGVGFFARGDINAIKAKQKQGKTTALKVMAAALLKGEQFRVKSEIERARTLWVDTEQKRTDVKLILTDIQQMTGLDDDYINSHLMLYALRRRVYSELLDDLKALLTLTHPDVVILDGIVEFVASFNDEGEAKQLIHDLLNLSETNNCAIVCVLHTNKADEDHNMRGHLGTMLSQKVGMELECKKVDRIITVRCSNSRHKEVPDWSICFDDDGHIVDADEQRKAWLEQRKTDLQQKRQEETERKNKERLDYALKAIRDNGGSMDRKQLTEILTKKFELKRPTVSTMISQWLSNEVLIAMNNMIHATAETALPF